MSAIASGENRLDERPSRGRFDAGVLSGPAAIAVAIVAQLTLIRRPEADIGLWLYLAAIAILILGSLGVRASPFPEPAGRDRADTMSTLVLVFAALLLRVVLLTQHPGIFGDEGERGMEARHILEGARPPLAGYGWWGVPNVYFYMLAGFLRLAGDGLWGLRLFSAVSGVAAVFFVARTGRLLWGRRAGLIAGALLAVSPVALQFSRLAGESTPMSALWAAGFFFVFRMLLSRRRRDAVLAGVLLGASLYFYAAAKLLLLIVPALAAVLLAFRPRREMPGLAGLLVLAFGLTFLPLAVTSWKNPNEFGGRYREASIFSSQNRPAVFGAARAAYSETWREETAVQSVARHPGGWTRVLFRQVGATLDVLYRRGDPTVFYRPGVHLGSMLSPIVAPLALLGLVWGLRNLRDVRFAVLGLWFWGGLLGAILTIDTPSVQRLAGAWPALMLFPAALLDHVATRWSAAGPRRVPALALAALIGAIAVIDTREYFFSYRALAPYGGSTLQARYAAALGSSYKVYELGVDGARSGDIFFGYGPTRFLAKGVEGEDVGALPSHLPIVDENGKGAVFLVYPSNAEFLPMLRLFYPEGREEVVADRIGPHFTVYRIEREELARARMLHAVFTAPDGKRLERAESNLGTVGARGTAESWIAPEGLVYPSRASWEGAFLTPEAGIQTGTLAGGGDAELWIDGRLVARESGLPDSAKPVAQPLARGLHGVRLEGTLTAVTDRILVRLSVPIPARMLFRRAFGGLSGEIWRGKGSLDALPSRPPDVRRLDPFLGFRYLQEDPSFPKDPFLARWGAMLQPPKAGEYELGLRSNGPSRLLMDGKPLLDVPARGDLTTRAVLEARPHSLEVRYAWTEDRPYVELVWTPPGGSSELVPPAFLSPPQRGGEPGPPLGGAMSRK